MGKIIEITKTIPVDIDLLWSDVWCSDGSGITYWCSGIRQANGDGIDIWRFEDDEIIPNPQDFQIAVFDEATNKQEWYTVTLTRLAEAWLEAQRLGYRHCGGDLLTDSDACVGDIVLQVAIFGELVYG